MNQKLADDLSGGVTIIVGGSTVGTPYGYIMRKKQKRVCQPIQVRSFGHVMSYPNRPPFSGGSCFFIMRFLCVMGSNILKLRIFSDHSFLWPRGQNTLFILVDRMLFPVIMGIILGAPFVETAHPSIITGDSADASHLPVSDISRAFHQHEVGAIRMGGGAR
jgi:hypothetical protein